MNFLVFVGIVLLVVCLYTIFNDLKLGLVWLIAGLAFILCGMWRKPKAKKDQIEDSSRRKEYKYLHDFNQLPSQSSSQQHQADPTDSTSNDATIHHSASPTGNFFLAYQYDDVKFYPPFDVVSKLNKNLLQAGANVILKPEPWNAYDDHAVALYVSGIKIGYLLRGRLQDMANDYLLKGWPIKSKLLSLKLNGDEYQGYISLSFYREAGESEPKRLGYSDIDIHSIHPTNPESQPNTPLTGKNIVFSGYFSIPINSAMQIAVDAGATLKSRITKNVNYLVVGMQDQSFLDENGLSSKEATAKRLMEEQGIDIQIINEETFLELAKATQLNPQN